MAVEAGPEGFGHRLRPVEQRDAANILELRTDPQLGRFLHPTPGGVENQERWIEAQRVREGDYYFVVERLDGRWEGVVSLYGIEATNGEWGRWILRRGSLAAPASVLLVFHFGFDQLGLRRIYGRTLPENVLSLSFQDACGFTSQSEYVEPGGRVYIEKALLTSDWPAFRDALVPTAERVARRGARS